MTAVSRTAPAVAPAPGVRVVRGDANDREQIAALLSGADAVVGATRPRPGQEHTVAATTTSLLDAAADAGARILIVGGAGPLQVPGRSDRLVLDVPTYIPEAWRTSAAASLTQLRACSSHHAGTYRRGGTILLTGADGSSRISVEDLAVAVLDELENPCGSRHFTVGY